MSVSTKQEGLTRAQAREQARELFRQSVAVGMPMTGRALAEQYGMSERWGQEQVRAVREELAESAAAGTERAAADEPQEANVRPQIEARQPQLPRFGDEHQAAADAIEPHAAADTFGETGVRFGRTFAADERDRTPAGTEPQAPSVTRTAERAAADEPREANVRPQIEPHAAAEPQPQPHAAEVVDEHQAHGDVRAESAAAGTERAAADEPQEANVRPQETAEPGLREVAGAARSVLAAAAIARLRGDRTKEEKTAAPVPIGAKIAGAIAAVLAMGAALAISYMEVAALGRAAGMEEHLALLLPMTADGLLLTGLITAWTRARRGERVGIRPVLALGIGGLATVAANVAARWFHVDAAAPAALWAWIPPVVAGYVPVAAALAAEQALALIRAGGKSKKQ